MLSDRNIQQAIHYSEIEITPYSEGLLQPASYELTLGDEFLLMVHNGTTIDLKKPQDIWRRITVKDSFVLVPGDFVLATTQQKVKLGSSITGLISGKSSLARVGLQVHATAGLVDPGFEGELTLELSTVAPLSVKLEVWEPIAQISFYRMDGPVSRPYGSEELGSKYQFQAGPTPALTRKETG